MKNARKHFTAWLLSAAMVTAMAVPSSFAAGASFSDTANHWGKASIDRWAEYGILNGNPDGTFNPDGKMTRAEFAKMLAVMMGYTEEAPNNFSDVGANEWYTPYILQLSAAGVMQGSNGKANPSEPISREETAVMLCRALKIDTSKANTTGFADDGSVSGWAKGAVATLAEKGMINGVGGNRFAPSAMIDRAAVAKMTDNMIGKYVTKSETITGDVKGIVLVVGKDAQVRMENATISENVVVAPASENAKVELTGNTKAADVVIEAPKSEVVVAATAEAAKVEVAGTEAKATVEGKAETVAVTAPKAEATVAENATVGKVEATAAAEAAKVTVAGKADEVTVAAPKAETTVEKTAEVGKVAVAATAQGSTTTNEGKTGTLELADNLDKDTTVDNKGTVETMVVPQSSAAANVSNNGTVNTLKTDADKGSDVLAGNTPSKTEQITTPSKPSEPSKPSGGGSSSGSSSSGSGSGGSTTDTVDVVKAPLFDQADEDKRIPADKLIGTYKVEGTKGENDADGKPTYNVTITASDVMNHNNAASPQVPGHWVGFGMPIEDGATYTYEVKQGSGEYSEVASIAGRVITEGSKKYNTVYFNEEADGHYDTYSVKQKKGGTVVATYNVTCNVTFWDNYTVTVASEIPTGNQDKATHDGYTIGTGKAGGSATINATDPKAVTMTITGEIDKTKLNTVSNMGYTYYSLIVNTANDNIKDIFNTADTAGGFPSTAMLDPTGEVVATAILDTTNNSFKKVKHEYTVRDKAEREQGKFSVTVDATGASVTGMKKVTFVDKDGNTVGNQSVDSGSITLPAVPDSTDTVYYTGNWIEGSSTKHAAGDSFTVSDNVTLKAESVNITAQSVKFRKNGVANDGETNYDYSAGYGKAGMQLDGSTIKVVGTTMVNFVTDNSNATELVRLTHGSPGTVYAGIEFPVPTGSAVSAAPTSVACGYTLDELKAITNSDFKPLNTPITNTGKFDIYDGTVIQYFGVATYDNSTPKVVTFKNDINAASDDNWLSYFVWKDASNNVVAVTSVRMGLTTTLPKCTVTFDSQEGSAVDPVTNAEYNKPISEPTAPTKANSIFKGWYKEQSCTTAWNFTNDKVTADTTLYAKWVDAVTVTFDGATVDGKTSVSVAKDEAYTLPTDSKVVPAGDGEFLGWYSDNKYTTPAPSIMPTKATTVYALCAQPQKLTWRQDGACDGTSHESMGSCKNELCDYGFEYGKEYEEKLGFKLTEDTDNKGTWTVTYTAPTPTYSGEKTYLLLADKGEKDKANGAQILLGLKVEKMTDAAKVRVVQAPGSGAPNFTGAKELALAEGVDVLEEPEGFESVKNDAIVYMGGGTATYDSTSKKYSHSAPAASNGSVSFYFQWLKADSTILGVTKMTLSRSVAS